MDNKHIQNVVSGVLVIDKPVGLTSHDVVQIIRRGTNIRRAGHTGTLDPRASGVLVVLVGPAVRLSEYVSASDKRYQATLRLGTSTDTYDAEGSVTRYVDASKVTEEQFEALLENYTGEIMQTPPPYSAVKVKGRPAYDRTREGEEVQLEPRKINVYSLEILEWAPPEAVLDVYCSSGTYVRSLAHDLGNDLGTGAYLIGLRRTKSGRFTLRDAVPLRQIQDAFITGEWSRYLIPAAEALADWPYITLVGDDVETVRHGHRMPAGPDAKEMIDPAKHPYAEEGTQGLVRAITEQGDLVAVMQYIEEDNEWQPKKVFFQS
ncbi:MAG TPA: tRNA pseudouridine(55) synthase TruB [Chloroflexi bacterium]|nr:tRNA pseudouridine(55) synthase TruB [Chloroflexota bacterium]HBY07015.1 tRNA pseudouridine(55) synthase TruB [Chloroflexota bacterium]